MGRMTRIQHRAFSWQSHRKTVLKQFGVYGSALALFLALAACTTTSGSFCEIAKPIRPANVDVLTDADVAAILQHNEKLAKLCGVRP